MALPKITAAIRANYSKEFCFVLSINNNIKIKPNKRISIINVERLAIIIAALTNITIAIISPFLFTNY